MALAVALTACTAAATPTTSTTAAPTLPPTTAATTLPPTTTEPLPVIEVWADPLLVDVLNDLGEAYTTSDDVVVDVVAKEFVAIRSDLLRGGPEAAPDLFVGAHAWTGELVAAGLVQPVPTLAPPVRGRFVEPAVAAFTVDGDLYGVPYSMEAVALWVNSTAIGPTPPETFDDVLDLCDDLPDESTCIAAPGGVDEPDAYYHYPFLSAFGATLFVYEPGTGYLLDDVGVDSPEAIQGATVIGDLSRGNYLPPLDYVTAKERFEEGQAAFWLTGPWEREAAETAAELRGFELTAITIPTVEGGIPRPFVDAQGIFLAADAAPEAVPFLSRVLTDGVAQRRLAAASGRLPAHDQAIARETSPSMQAFIESATNGIPTPNLAGITDDVWTAWGTGLMEVRNREKEPEEALSLAARRIRVAMGIAPPPPPTTTPEE